MRTTIGALGLTIGTLACHDSTGSTPTVPCDPDNGGLTLPPGFCATVLARGLGDGTLVGMCQDLELPLLAFPAHWAPLSMLFYTGGQFPAEYADGLFVVFHGSQPAPPAPGAGFVVTFVPWKNGQPDGAYRVFANGFAGGNFTVAGAAHRPVGLAQGPDGEIYISDDRAGWIWRVSYVAR